MARCCDENDAHPLELLPAGLDALPRQLAAFPEIRQRLRERLVDPDDEARRSALGDWRPYVDDFGSMSLEMWAYVGDVLGFYDARVADESYLGTAVRRPSLRRLVGLLGYSPRPGVAGTATIAALADGTQSIAVPAGTGVRSRSFDGHPPQVFETSAAATIHPLLNSWTIEPFRRHPTVDASFLVGGDTDAGGEAGGTNGGKGGGTGDAGSGENRVNRMLFLPDGFGLAVDALCLIEGPAGSEFEPQVALVTAREPFSGRDGKAYTRISFDRSIVIAEDVDLSTLRARRPVQSLTPTVNEPLGSGSPPPLGEVNGATRLYVDGPPAGVRAGDTVIVTRDPGGEEPAYHITRITEVKPAAVVLPGLAEASGISASDSLTSDTGDGEADTEVDVPPPMAAATELRLAPPLPSSFASADRLSFDHGFVDAGRPTNVCRTTISASDLMDAQGVPITGQVRLPRQGGFQGLISEGSDGEVIESRFLIADAEGRGALADGRVTVAADGTARFEALSDFQIDDGSMQLPLTVYGNVLDVSRGESVRGEVLGSGDARISNQQFKLRNKPLTYLPDSVTGTGDFPDSTLVVRVDGIAWRAVKGFFGCGPGDRVYTVRHDDQQNTHVVFGDGKFGARLPSGVGNVVADYRFGAGAAAPPAGAIRQLADSLKGLRAVRSPVAADAGADPDAPEDLRGAAPQTALLLGRAVSALDFQALARTSPGVVAARAEWLWIPDQWQAGVVVHYIGSPDAGKITETLKAQADPTVPIAVTQAQPIAAELSLTVATDPRRVAADVANAVAEELSRGVLAPEHAVIGGTFWASGVFEAAAAIDGVVAVSAMSFAGPEPTLLPKVVGGTCLPTGRYLDFSAPGAVRVTGVPAVGLPPVAGKGGQS